MYTIFELFCVFLLMPPPPDRRRRRHYVFWTVQFVRSDTVTTMSHERLEQFW